MGTGIIEGLQKGLDESLAQQQKELAAALSAKTEEWETLTKDIENRIITSSESRL